MRKDALTVRDAAARIGIAAATISRAARGRQVNGATLAAICRHLRRSPAEFMPGSLFETRPLNAAGNPLEALEVYLRAAPNMPEDLATAIMNVVHTFSLSARAPGSPR